MERICQDQYRLERIYQAINSIKRSAILCVILFVLRSYVLYATCPNHSCFGSELWLLSISVILIGFTFLCPFLSNLIQKYSLSTCRLVHVGICAFLSLVQVTLPIITVVTQISDEYDRASAITPFLSMSLYLATNVCREKMLAFLCLLNCLATFYYFVHSKAPLDFMGFTVRFLSGASFGVLMLFSNEDDRKANFLLRWMIEKKEQMYRHFLEALPIKVVIFGARDGDVKYQNDYQTEVLGHSILNDRINTAEEFMTLIRKIKNSKGETLADLIENFSSQSQNPVFTGEYYLKESGKTRILSVTVLGPSLFFEKRTIGIMLDDITEKSALEEERNARKYANALLCSLSHELKTPLNVVIGTLEQIEEYLKTKDAPEMTTMVRQSKSCAVILNYTINGFLDFVKYQTNQLVLSQSLVNIRDHVKSIHAACKNTVTHPINFEYEIDSRVPETIEMDPERIKLVLMNLLTNAIKYTKEGHVKLEINVKNCRSNKKKIVFRVKDTGTGMNQTQLANLFKLTNRIISEGLDSRQAQGSVLSGLGLTISQILCKVMGSKIKVKSCVGAGTTFWFGLPAENSPPFKKSQSDDESDPLYIWSIPEEDSEIVLHKQNYHKSGINQAEKQEPAIIIVDDTDLNRLVIRKTAEKYNVKIVECQNGKEAIQAFVDECLVDRRKAVIFMDIEMPHMDGIQATIKIRGYRTKHPPIIVAVTAYDTVEEKQKCKAAKFDYFYPKPISGKCIKEHIEEVLNKRKQRYLCYHTYMRIHQHYSGNREKKQCYCINNSNMQNIYSQSLRGSNDNQLSEFFIIMYIGMNTTISFIETLISHQDPLFQIERLLWSITITQYGLTKVHTINSQRGQENLDRGGRPSPTPHNQRISPSELE
eukprot:TRINITY_DN1082_c0_g1_i1.p1 TRINITY_DN1082_c0_g1~~TRINITY_DN1082_c0_g1_i1.p1  ORF type:complete len:878 (+),score=34.20 TRINITY_DN1082_c0_g1_i1:175-2808(+)